MSRKRFVPVVIILIIVVLIIAGCVWYWQKAGTFASATPQILPPTATTSAQPSSRNTTSSIGLPAPLYLGQMDACKTAGGQVKEETKNMGSWQALAQWECICKNGSLFFGDHLACNQWVKPTL